jgi:hypothetical protein
LAYYIVAWFPMLDKKWNWTVFRRLHRQICFKVIGDDSVKRLILMISLMIGRRFFTDKETFILEG